MIGTGPELTPPAIDKKHKQWRFGIPMSIISISWLYHRVGVITHSSSTRASTYFTYYLYNDIWIAIHHDRKIKGEIDQGTFLYLHFQCRHKFHHSCARCIHFRRYVMGRISVFNNATENEKDVMKFHSR